MIDNETRRRLGLVCVETLTPSEMLTGVIFKGLRTEVRADELYRDFVDSNSYFPGAALNEVWNYLKDPHNATEWCLCLRDVQVLEDRDTEVLFKATDKLLPGGTIFGRFVTDPKTHTIDCSLGEDPDRLWITSSAQLLDSEETTGRPGTIMLWTFFRHAAYGETGAASELWRDLPAVLGLLRDNLSRMVAFLYAGRCGHVVE